MKIVIFAFIVTLGGFSVLQASFESSYSEISPEIEARMSFSWKGNNPVPLSNLRYLTVTYLGFDGEAHIGELVVHRDVATELINIFEELFLAQFPIEKMLLIDLYEANDDRSMEDNNTSAFCSRAIVGIPGEFSLHSYGTAIDINPKLNPFVEEDLVLPESGRFYLQRDDATPGIITESSICYKAFVKRGWHWGGAGWDGYPNRKDYQHFEKEPVSL